MRQVVLACLLGPDDQRAVAVGVGVVEDAVRSFDPAVRSQHVASEPSADGGRRLGLADQAERPWRAIEVVALRWVAQRTVWLEVPQNPGDAFLTRRPIFGELLCLDVRGANRRRSKILEKPPTARWNAGPRHR